ncbi:MAG: UDP-N-acetylmuramoyl-tripeptide--D-alanyl-D-alanine ligase [Rhodocyclaceae bacterium]|nr:UDP-N-acetylmuramoyl-tripeptide--D-alanyl-D-alanine ligase [Rhodocyclaceae bacterium]
MLTLAEAARATLGRATLPGTTFASVFSDSRVVDRGGLFVALRGERFDGHDFVRQVLDAGAAAALVAADSAVAREGADLPLVIVEDTREGLRHLAAAWRRRFAVPVIAVTGSNGKTTVKEMVSAILAAAFGTEGRLATAGNLNNDIGLPLTVLRLREGHRAAAIELGMNHPGETAVLAAVAQPTVALINNAQREHQEFMKSVAAVAEEHGALIAALPSDGIAVINADDAFAGYWRDLAAGRPTRSFGLEAPADVTCGWTPGKLGSRLEIRAGGETAPVELSILGVHNVRNALAAAAAAMAAGLPLTAVVRGLAAFRPAKGRLQLKEGAGGATVIDDTYNANPDSVRAAIDVLAARPGRRILVLGDMGEVGEQAGQFHDEVGGYAKSMGIERLLTLGEASRAASGNFGPGARHFERAEDLIAVLAPDLDGRTTTLVKGSRFMRMERVVDAICPPPPKNGTEAVPAGAAEKKHAA